MKYFIILFFLSQFSFSQEIVNYNDCEIFPKLLSGKNFTREIISKLKLPDDVIDSYNNIEISFLVNQIGFAFQVESNIKSINNQLYEIIKNLGSWQPGENNGKKCLTKIKWIYKW